MNNHALKLVKEKGSVSLKIHDLVKMPEDDFTNLGKQNLYENAKAYHKKQKGILRVSKYEFYSTKENRLAMLKKHPMEIQKIYFHGVDKDTFEQAQKKFEALVDEFSYEELVSYLEAQNYKKN